ncbi:hypothetical protein G4B88_023569 [Cannabis sativa]|uniref:Reverse transcriptase zinc-binding domain-containing protein n=1 Tax=Cannabis sativa TaxID=3483 RepID=A0A7J6HVF4_CANSA|nr:hypothetical protein G4B88_023569 [Cannabis sativa]
MHHQWLFKAFSNQISAIARKYFRLISAVFNLFHIGSAKKNINAYAEKDLIIWKDSKVGAFSVKGAYLSSQKSRLVEKQDLWNWIWNCKIHPRQSMMLWRAVVGALPTSDKYGRISTNDYLFCCSDNESPLHIFVKCSMAKALWFGGPFPLRTESIPGATLSEVICSILPLLEGSSKLSFLIWMASVFETIWLWRNRARYGRIVNILVDEMLNNALNRFVEMSDTHKPSFEQMLPVSNGLPVPGFVSKVILADESFKDGNFGGAIVRAMHALLSRIIKIFKILQLLSKAFPSYFRDLYVTSMRKFNLVTRLVQLYKPYVLFKGIFDDTNSERLRGKAQERLNEEAFKSSMEIMKLLQIYRIFQYLFYDLISYHKIYNYALGLQLRFRELIIEDKKNNFVKVFILLVKDQVASYLHFIFLKNPIFCEVLIIDFFTLWHQYQLEAMVPTSEMC